MSSMALQSQMLLTIFGWKNKIFQLNNDLLFSHNVSSIYFNRFIVRLYFNTDRVRPEKYKLPF